MTIHLDLRTDLAKVRANINLKDMGRCLYASPCAIGAMIDHPADRERLDHVKDQHGAAQVNIVTLISQGEISAPTDQHAELKMLQEYFDSSGEAEEFEQYLTELEQKYAK